MFYRSKTESLVILLYSNIGHEVRFFGHKDNPWPSFLVTALPGSMVVDQVRAFLQEKNLTDVHWHDDFQAKITNDMSLVLMKTTVFTPMESWFLLPDLLKQLDKGKGRIAYLKVWQYLLGVDKENLLVIDKVPKI